MPVFRFPTHRSGLWLAAALLALLAGLAPCLAQGLPAGKVAATAVSVEKDGNATRLIVDLTAPVDVTAGVLLKPSRMTIDLPNVVFHAAAGSGQKGQGLIAGYRFGMFIGGASRIVLDLAAPARLQQVETVPGPAGSRLIVRLVAATVAEFELAARAAETRLAAGPPGDRPAAGQGGLPLIIIDPGHGGIDPGASNGKEVEKDLVLQFGLLLRDKLQQRGNIRVEMTRSDDTFVPLGERVRYARDRGARFFISIHADTLSDGAGVRGATIYTNADRASDERSARLAEKENKADLVAGIEDAEEQSDVADILFDLTRRETRQLSAQFARRLMLTLQRTIHINKNPLRSAKFIVLRAYDVPSILLELGYLSSKDDVEQLTSPAWQQATANAVADALTRSLARIDERGGPSAAGLQQSGPL